MRPPEDRQTQPALMWNSELSRLHLLAGDLGAAKSHATSALSTADTIGDRRRAALAAIELGTTLGRLGEKDTALDLYYGHLPDDDQILHARIEQRRAFSRLTSGDRIGVQSRFRSPKLFIESLGITTSRPTASTPSLRSTSNRVTPSDRDGRVGRRRSSGRRSAPAASSRRPMPGVRCARKAPSRACSFAI